jgi:hypothetical protein
LIYLALATGSKCIGPKVPAPTNGVKDTVIGEATVRATVEIVEATVEFTLASTAASFVLGAIGTFLSRGLGKLK